MSKYQSSYYILWKSTTDAIHAIENMNYGFAKMILLEGQKKAEDAFIDWEETAETQQSG